MDTTRIPRIRDYKGRTFISENAPDFDTSKDYGNEYAKVHFRVIAQYYKYPYGDYEGKAEAETLFDQDTKELFEELGWEFDLSANNSYSNTVRKGKQELYLHPHDFSGEILKNEILTIHNALQGRKTFKYEAADVYETVYDMTNEETMRALESKKAEVEKALTLRFETDRRTQFIPEAAASEISSKYAIKRVGVRYEDMGLTFRYVVDVVAELVQKGYLVKYTDDTGTYYRTINKTEQRKMKVTLCA